MKRNIIIILAVVLMFMLLSCSSKEKELTAKVDNLTKTVTSLGEENRKLKERIDQLETETGELSSQIGGVEESLLFDVPDYPVRYQLTKESYDDFKAQLIELTKNSAAVTGADEEELNEALMMLEYMENTLLDEFLGDASYIELIDEDTVYLEGETLSYYIEDGYLYIYGGKLGTIDDEVLTITEEDEGLTISFKFYRTTPKSGKITLGEKIEGIETKIDNLYSSYY